MLRLISYFIFFLIIHSTCGAHTGDHPEGLRHKEIASPDPDRIFLSFIGDPATTRGVNWRTDASVKQAFAEIAAATGHPDFQDAAVRLPAITQVLDLNEATVNRQGVVHFHSANFENLLADTLYAYRVGDGEGAWSEWIQFRTAPDKPEPFSFLYFGDAQNDIFSRWSRVIRMAYQVAPDARFAVHAGDLVNTGHADGEWAEWFSAGSFIHSQLTGVPVCGNHEYRPLGGDQNQEKIRSIHWRPQFNLPVETDLPKALHESVYTVEYQDLQIIVLDTNSLLEEQTAYLERQLQKKGFNWRMVTYHHSLYSPLGRDGSNYELMLSQWVPLFNQYGVDIVLQGHDHLYARGHMDPAPLNSSGAGPVYVTSVSGPKQYKIKPEVMQDLKEKGYAMRTTAENTQFFQVIHVDGDAIVYESYDATGELFDSFTIRRNSLTGKKSLSQ